MSTDRLGGVGAFVPVVFLGTSGVLSLLESDFMSGLGWHGWPSGLALGPYGWLQQANFVVSGLLLVVLSVGLNRFVTGRTSKAGVVLMLVSGIAMVLLSFNTDPRGAEQTAHGFVHLAAYLLFVASLLLAYVLLGLGLRRDERWRGLRWVWVAALLFLALGLVVELPRPFGNVSFFAGLLIPAGGLGYRLRRTSPA